MHEPAQGVAVAVAVLVFVGVGLIPVPWATVAPVHDTSPELMLLNAGELKLLSVTNSNVIVPLSVGNIVSKASKPGSGGQDTGRDDFSLQTIRASVWPAVDVVRDRI
jgi:hypothetical protein